MTNLFVVPKQSIQELEEVEQTETELFELSGVVKADLENALRALAFLLDFVDLVGGADGLRGCADAVREFRVQP